MNERIRQWVDAISGERLMVYTQEIAKWVRLSGSDAERESFLYVKEVLEGCGLKTSLLEHDAYISLPGAAMLEVTSPEALSLQCITHAMAAPTVPEGLEAEILFVGAGGPAELEGIDLTGKIAVTLGLAMPVKVRALELRGAIGQIHINAQQMHEMIVSTVWGNPTPQTVGRMPNTPVVSIPGSDGERLLGLLERGPVRVRMRTEVDTGWRKIPLLVADLPAAGTDDFVMFSGHIDSWHFGAMDNGTANATMIEVARVLAPHREHLRRGLRFCFWSGHSHGRYAGSTWYADHYWEELYDHCVAHINIDSVGGSSATVLTEGIIMREATGLAHEVIQELTGERFEGSRCSRAGDQSFWGVGIPSMFMSLSEQPAGQDETAKGFALLMGGHAKTGGLGWWWHTPEDTIDKIDPEFLLRDARIYTGVIGRLLMDPILPFEYAATVREIQQVVADLQASSGDRFDLGLALGRLHLLIKQAEALSRVAAELRRAPETSVAARRCERVNEGLKRLGRLLIPLNYCKGGPYDHDLAMAIPPVPILQPLRQLAALAPNSHEALLLEQQLVRARNQVNQTLREALDSVRGALDAAE